MSTSPYATVDDLHAYLGTDPPLDSQRLLARAQDLVDAILNTSSYVIDANGNPTDAATIAAFKEAVCAQVEYWITNGDELDLLGNWTSYTMAGLSVSRFGTKAAGARHARLCERAQDALSSVAATATFGRALTPGKPVI
jgi:polygalacturonase